MEVHTLALMNSLIAAGYDIELIANRYYRYDEIVHANGWDDVVRVVHTGLGGLIYGEASDAHRWKSVLENVRGDVMIFPKGNNNYGTLGFLRVCRRRFGKVIFIEHLEPRARPTRRSRRWLGLIPGMALWWHWRRFSCHIGSLYADRVVAVSNLVRDRLVDDFGYARDKVTVVQNGVDWRAFARDATAGTAFRERLGIEPDAFVFGMLTRLAREKGIDVVLQALRMLIEGGVRRPFYVVVAGEGPKAQELLDLARELKVDRWVRFVGFVDSRSVVSGYDVILFASRREGLPLGLLEGMAAGCLPIVTRISGMPEAVNSPEIGWVVPPDRPEELARAMGEALSLSAAEIAAHRVRVLRRIRDHFDVTESHRRLLAACDIAVHTGNLVQNCINSDEKSSGVRDGYQVPPAARAGGRCD
jgi:glycosyltransferase involved in cell wall biosynthesis